MTYVRHRARMVHESVVEDLTDTLIACRWIPGTTTREVNNPTGGAFEVVTVDDDEVFALVGTPLTVVNFFPDPASGPPAMNTLAIDMPRPADPTDLEMGSGLQSQPYQISLALYAESDALAQALLSDLQDRYAGRLVRGQAIGLYDYLTDPDAVVAWMDVEAFRFARDVESALPSEIHIYYAELEFADVVD